MLFTNRYSGLITKGLGMEACCGMMTLGFGLFSCMVIILPPSTPSPGTGGSIAVNPGIYVPWKGKPQQKTKNVQIIVKFSKEKVWRRAYVVNNRGADFLVGVINIVNAASSRLSIGVEHMKLAAKKVTAMFSRADK